MARAALVLALLLSVAPIARAQQQSTEQKNAEQRIRDERARLEALKNEREELQRRRTSLQNTVHDLSEEVETLDREADVTARVMHSLDSQLDAISAEVGATTADLVRAQDEITVKQATLRRRLVDIDKRGPLFSFEVLLSARSFGELLARYKYLHLLAVRDQTLVHRVEDLRNQINHQRANLVRFQENIKLNLDEKAEEEDRLRTLKIEQSRSLAKAKRSAQDTDARLKAIGRDEARLTDVIANLEAARLRAERSSPNVARAPSTIRKGAGTMDWPVQGDILYSYGRVVNPNNTTVRWNGIGIKAAAGTEVHAVAAGKVLVADQFGTYGLTVIVQHPGGDYSVYGSLSKITTEKGAVVTKGQVIGYVGTADPDLPAHLHFELRPQGRAVDPMDFLRPNP
jgi:septal ring factor EnvC (AmiA/AmiB activator)